MRLGLLGLMATSIAIAVEGLGALLVLAVLVAPPVAVAGIHLSALVGSAAGASVALVLCAAAALGAMPWRRAGRAPRRPAAAPGRAR